GRAGTGRYGLGRGGLGKPVGAFWGGGRRVVAGELRGGPVGPWEGEKKGPACAGPGKSRGGFQALLLGNWIQGDFQAVLPRDGKEATRRRDNLGLAGTGQLGGLHRLVAHVQFDHEGVTFDVHLHGRYSFKRGRIASQGI